MSVDFDLFVVGGGPAGLATAIAAIPSPRPMNPISSLVVAFTPICFPVSLRAVAMFSFIPAMCG